MQLSNYSGKYFSSTDVLNSFLTDVRRYAVPTVAEEEKLFEAYRGGDETAKDKLILGNLRFVYALAKIYARNESEVIDYVNEGVIGLMLALNDFDPTKGYKFLTYGVWYVRRQMNYYMLTKRDIVSHSAQVGNIGKKSDVIRQKYYAENGILPTNEEVRKILKENFNISVSKDEDMFDSAIKSIDEDICEDYTVEDGSEYNEATASENDYETAIEREHMRAIVDKYLSALPERMAKIVMMRFGIGYDRAYDISEIGRRCGMTDENIAKVCDEALLRMRNVKAAKIA